MAIRRPRIKPTANLSIKRPCPPNAVRAAPVKEEKTESAGSSVKTEKVTIAKEEPASQPTRPPDSSPQHLPPSPRPPTAASPFLLPRPSPSPSPVAHIFPSRSPAHTPQYTNSERMGAHFDDSIFKSPIMSPSYPPQSRTPNIPNKIIPLDNRLADLDSMKSPGSPSKAARHRFRPTPVLQQRRNSVQINEDEEQQLPRIPHQRMRHISTSSTTSVQKFVPQAVGRIRTESSCSAFSDVSVFKPRRAARSDEYLRLCEARKELLLKCNGATPDKSQLRMYDMIYYNPKTNPMKSQKEGEAEKGEKERRSSVSSNVAPKVESGAADAPTSDKEDDPAPAEVEMEEAAMPVPQLKLGPNGEMILDEKSLTIEATGEKEARAALAKAEIVYDDLHSSSGFYKRHKRTKDWAPDETIRFYRCLQVIGTDFSLMLDLFPNRSRRDLKLKFKKEEKANGFLINKALIDHSSFDIELLKETFKKEDETKEADRLKADEAKNNSNVDRVELIKKLKQRPSRSAVAVDDRNLDLENQHLKFRQHKPQILRQISAPASVPSPPPSAGPPARRTPTLRPPPSPQQRPLRSPGKVYYDLNLNCSTPAEEDPTLETNLQVITLAPKSVEPCQDADLIVHHRPPALKQEIAVKKEKTDSSQKFPAKPKPVPSIGKKEANTVETTMDETVEDEVDDDDDDEDTGDGIDLNNLVVMESIDLENNGKIIYKVHLMDKETDEMSEEPLELPQEVIDYIVEVHQRNQLGGT